MDVLSTHHVDRTPSQLLGLVGLTATLYVAAGLGMAYIAGFGVVERRIDHAQWWWLAPSFAAVVLAFCGYYFAYRGVRRVEGGPELDRTALLAAVVAGFGGFLAHGGTPLDDFAMRAGGASKREAKVRISALAGFEHGTLAMIVCPAAIASLTAGLVIPRTDLTWPWAIIPPPAFVLVIWLAERYRDRLHHRGGWRARVAIFLDTAHLVYVLITRLNRHGLALIGMALYWASDMFALWAATAAFGFHMTILSVIVCLGTGMLFTRRTAPLAGAGVLTVALVPTLWYGAAVPFAAATLGVAAYRFLTLWAPLPWSLAAIPKLRELERTSENTPDQGTPIEKDEPALEHGPSARV